MESEELDRKIDQFASQFESPWSGKRDWKALWSMIKEISSDFKGVRYPTRDERSAALIEPGKPWQNGMTESFNGKFRDECLSLEWFRARAEAKVIIETWRRHYNEVRPHSSLGYLTPNEFAARHANAAPRHATGRGAAVHGAFASRPVAQPPREGQMQQAEGAVSS
jgi:putative transposase